MNNQSVTLNSSDGTLVASCASAPSVVGLEVADDSAIGGDQDVPPFPPTFDVPITNLFTENSLKELQKVFEKGPMSLNRFMNTITDLLQLEDNYASCMVPNLFSAVDTYRKGSISFMDLCQYLYEDYFRQDIWKGVLERMNLTVPGRIITPKIHRPPPVKMVELEDIHMLFSKDGTMSYWSNSFKIRKCRSLKTREIEKERQYGKVYCDIVVIELIGKFIVSTGDKEIQFFDLQSLEPYCQIHRLPSCACSLDAKLNSQNILIIVFGDWLGGVNVFQIPNVTRTLRNWSEKPKVLGIAATTLEEALSRKQITIYRWKIHERRVDRVIYIELLGGQIISCSTDPNNALSIGCAFPPFSEQLSSQLSNLTVLKRPTGEEQSYNIPFGVQTIDVWEEKRLLAASGVDRMIRIWNLMTRGDAIATLQGHMAPIRHIKFFPPVLVSISMLKIIQIWDLHEFRCIQNINPLITKIKGQDVLFLHCSKLSNAVMVQTNEDLYAFQVRKKVIDNETAATHSGSIVGGEYNDLLQVWITCSKSLVKVWDARTGKKKYEFEVSNSSDEIGEEHINEELRFRAEAAVKRKEKLTTEKISGRKRNYITVKTKYYPNLNKPGHITCMHVEKMGKRLLTGHANGVIKEFNFVSGMNIRTMGSPKHTKEEIFGNSVNGVTYVRSALNDNLLSFGSNKVIDVYPGSDPKATEPVTSWNCYRGHEDDIWCVTSTEPNFLITGSFEGLVILWNFTSGKIEGRLLPPNFDRNNEYDMNKVCAVSIYKRKTTPDDGTEVMYLFTAGPESGMHMWEIYWKIKHFYYRGRIRPWRSATRYICSLAAAPEQMAMIAADNLGDVYIFDMKTVKPMQGLKYNPRGFEFNEHLKELMSTQLPEMPLNIFGVTTVGMPELKKIWSAHLGGIPVLTVCERYGLILTGDTGGKARIWNFCGHYIGMLGQVKEWDIYNPKSYLHPEVPPDTQSDFSRIRTLDAEDELDKRYIHPGYENEMLDVSSAHVVDNSDDYKLTDSEIKKRAKDMIVYKKVLPDFLKFKDCYKIVYRNNLFHQKHSLTPVYKRIFDNELVKGYQERDD